MVLKQDRPMIFIPIHDEYWVDPLDVANFEQVSTADIIEKYDMRVERLGFDHGTNILVQPYGSAFTSSIDLKLTVPKN